MNIQYHPKAILFLISATVLWGLNFHLAKNLLLSVDFIQAGFWRYIFGVGFLFVVQITTGSSFPFFKQLYQNIKGYFLAGFIGLFGFSIFFFLGLKYTSALNAALQVSLNPVLTLLFAYWILGTPIYRHQKIGMAIGLLGVFLLITRGRPTLLLETNWSYGDMLIFMANILFAIHNIWVKKYYTSSVSNISFTLITNGFCLVGFLLFLPFYGITPIGQLDAIFWLSALGIGILGTGLAYILWNEGIKMTGAANAGFFMNIVPFATAIFSISFGEQIELYHLGSGGLILIGMIYFQGVFENSDLETL
jgi:drug/metabolite transporter (DMT)-like permease